MCDCQKFEIVHLRIGLKVIVCSHYEGSMEVQNALSNNLTCGAKR